MNTTFTESIETREMRPDWTDLLVPWCSEKCPSHDGKRCELMGCEPSRICEPAVIDMASRAAAAFDLATAKK